MNDIVVGLREAGTYEHTMFGLRDLLNSAADEIERLRHQVRLTEIVRDEALVRLGLMGPA